MSMHSIHSMRAWSRTTPMRIALTLLGVAVIVTLWTVVRALRTDPLPDVGPAMVASLEGAKRGAHTPPTDIQVAWDNDLFASDRSAPSNPYRMPGESGSDDKPVVEPLKPTVLGTAVASDGRSFATMQLGDSSPTLVHVGDKIGEWTVKSIARGKVVLLGTTGSRAELGAPKPGT
jgi:hypothetical protein